MCVHLTWTGQPTVGLIFLLYYYFLLYVIIINIHNFNILPVRSDIYFFLQFNIRNMKQARFKLLNDWNIGLTVI